MALFEPRQIFMNVFKALRHLLVCVFSLVTQCERMMKNSQVGFPKTFTHSYIHLCPVYPLAQPDSNGFAPNRTK